MKNAMDSEALKREIASSRERTIQEQFERVMNLVRVLRRECPWDRKQTPESLAHLLLEESYELVDAIDSGDERELRKELGDLFLHVCFQAELGREAGKFTFEEVMDGLCRKLIHRHPHVFADTTAETEGDVLKNWESLKMQEGRKKLLEGVPKAMPELLRAYRVQKKVSGVGFDWPSGQGVLQKLSEEVRELEEAATPEEREEEFGDILFTLVNYSRFIGTNPEDALRRSTAKFIGRFERVEEQVQESGREWRSFTPEELDILWREAKGQNG
ncbi:nucleoside triphosphate pyrophosphohydrolase [Chlorobium sp. N1]|uniref:nucleoside triphosphate pyrophosphohydrolase n=1 Tax=Chlorobium sp. N1 TaxID=2491138 RepID=UPI00103C9403|nr:nucleoside triphosphate pyrophosphohydrolase [Chlorobium sp. N1]TCD48096.1 nucleoside triphosphate pyrophosphohydrolase [Chlorobium sp. N1]